MPLHAQSPAPLSHVLQSLDQPVRTPGRRTQIPTDLFNPLVVVAVDDCAFASGQTRESAFCVDRDTVRRSFARRALLVFERRRKSRRDVLYERSAARDVPDLYAVADGQKRQTPLLRCLQYEQVRLVAQGMYAAKLRLRLSTVEQRVNVRVAARKEYPVQALDNRLDERSVRDER